MMIIKKFKIPLYDYEVTYIRLAHIDGEDKQVEKILTRMGANAESLNNTLDDMRNKRVDGGEHYFNLQDGKSVVIIFPCRSNDKLISIIAHEKRHLEDRVLQWASVNDIESAGFLAGYLAKMMQ